MNGRRNAAKLSRHEVVFIPGDRIGPEATGAVQRILDAARAPIAWVECRAGLHAIDHGQNASVDKQHIQGSANSRTEAPAQQPLRSPWFNTGQDNGSQSPGSITLCMIKRISKPMM